MSDVIGGVIGIIVGALLVLIIRRAMDPSRDQPEQGELDTGLRNPDAWVITPEDVRKATSSLTAAAHPDPAPPYGPHPEHRIRYRPHLGCWAVYKWLPEHAYYYGYGIRYPIEGRWVLQTRVPTWHDAINLITPNPATERGSSHKEEQ